MQEAQNRKVVQDAYAAFGRVTLRGGKAAAFQEFIDVAAVNAAFVAGA